MIPLQNGIRIFVNHHMKKDIYIGISDFGFEKDVYDNILGIAHLLEHILISFDNRYFNANASTARSYMSFWCEALRRRHYEDAIKTAVSWFFDKNGVLKTDFSDVSLHNYIAELENEYYYRTEMYHCMDALAYLYGGDLYNGGRITMLDRINDVKTILSNRMKRLSGKNIVIFIKKLTAPVYLLLSNTFGNIPKFPNIIPLDREVQDAKNNIIMMPYPFYTLLIQVENNLNNILAIICLVENYNLIDYETIGDKLYVSISFAEEDQYEYFLYNIRDMQFDINSIKLDLGEDYIMNLYISFPLLETDIDQYIHTMTLQSKHMIGKLKDNMYESILANKFIIIYPSFTKSLYNLTDKQNHGLLVVQDVNFKYNPNIVTKQISAKDSDYVQSAEMKNIFYKKTRECNNVVISYSDNSFFNYAIFYHILETKYDSKKLSRFRTDNGIRYKHCFNNDDLTELVNSDTFIRYNSSKPAVLYQYILLAYFATDKTIKEILGYKNQVIQLDNWKLGNNKIVFGKTTRYDIYTKSTFVCGIIKGRKINSDAIINYMWQLKRKGLIYYMSHTKLPLSNTYYIFTFTIFEDKVYKFFTTIQEITKYCLIVSHKNNKSDEDNYSSLNKNIIINIK